MDHTKSSWSPTALNSGTSNSVHQRRNHAHTTSSSSNCSLQAFLEFQKATQRVYDVESLQDEVDKLGLLFNFLSPYLGGNSSYSSSSTTSSSGHTTRKSGQPPRLQLEDIFVNQQEERQLEMDQSDTNVDVSNLRSQTPQHNTATHKDQSNSLPESKIRLGFLQDFLYYTFNRRFGWSEMGKHTYLCSTGATQDNNSMMMTMMNEKNGSLTRNSVWKSQLNEILDEILLGLQRQDVSNVLLQCLQHTMLRAVDKPVVRNQTIIHTLEWLKRKVLVTPIFELCFPVVKEIFVIGLTDVWSAIRSATASRLVPILQHLSLHEYQLFFQELIKVCKGSKMIKDNEEQKSKLIKTPTSMWQSKEGAIIGIHVMIKAFTWVKREGRYGLCLGRQFLPQMPEFITDGLKDIGELLMCHPQTTIREYTVKCFATLAVRSHFSERLEAFELVLGQLSAMLDLDSKEPWRKTEKRIISMQSNFLMRKGDKQNNAYIAESLLGILLAYVKTTHPSILLPNWPLHFCIISPYLGHPASTVRQAASLLFKVGF